MNDMNRIASVVICTKCATTTELYPYEMDGNKFKLNTFKLKIFN